MSHSKNQLVDLNRYDLAAIRVDTISSKGNHDVKYWGVTQKPGN